MTDEYTRLTRTIHQCAECKDIAQLIGGLCESCRRKFPAATIIDTAPRRVASRDCVACGGDDMRCPYCWGGKGTG